MVAAAAAAAIGGAFSLAGAKKGAKAAKDAAEIQAEASREALAFQRDAYDDSRVDSAPYRAVGPAALNRLASSFGVAPANTLDMRAGADGSFSVADRQTQGTISPITAPPGSTEAILQGIGFGSARNRQGTKLSSAELAANFHPNSLQTFLSLDDEGKKAWMAQSGFTPFEDPLASVPQMVDVATQGGPDPLDASMDQMNRLAAGFEASPGYQFRLQEGENALMRAQGARGKLLSGDAIKEAQQFGQGLASDEYNTYMNRATSAFGDYNNRLASLAGVGQSATQAGMQAGQNFANSAGNILTQGGNNQANALLAGGAIQAGGLGSIGQGIQNAYGNYAFMNALKPPRAPAFAPPAVTGTAGGGGVPFYGVGGSPY